MLNARRSPPWPRRREATSVLRATASVAGAGPKSSAVEMKNVSEIVTLAETVPIFIENDPVSQRQRRKQQPLARMRGR